MPLLVNQQPAADDGWIFIENEEQLAEQAETAKVLLPWELYLQQADSRSGETAPVISGAEDLAAVAEQLLQLPLVGIAFPKFNDGRGFSQARLLREQYGFNGQLRAVGDVTRDRLRFMHRCGIDAMQIAADRYSDDITNVFSEISVRNQGAVDDPRPIYRQQEAQEA